MSKRVSDPAAPSFAEAMANPLGYVQCEIDLGPDSYALICRLNDLAPVINDGDTVICDPDVECIRGDYVSIWWKGGDGPSVKRLAFGLPPKFMWPGTDGLEAMLVCDQHNPSQRISASLADVEAVHKVVRTKSASEGGSDE